VEYKRYFLKCVRKDESVDFIELEIVGSWLSESPINSDGRGHFREWFKASEFEQVLGRPFRVAQANISISHRGVLRGIHYSLAEMGQGKWVTCASGAIWDVVVDLRPESPTFKRWIGVHLSAENGKAIFVPENLGHAFISLEDNSVVTYLLTSPYSPKDEHGIHPLDPELAIEWPSLEMQLSAKDSSAPTLKEMIVNKMLPN